MEAAEPEEGARGVLYVNPRSGGTAPDPDDLAAAARMQHVRVHVLQEGEDAGELARRAPEPILGMAGGDGSLAVVASVALERNLPFVCVPLGTRNHFARDVGLDAEAPLSALEAFSNGIERRIDVGRVGERLFLNNVSLGLYARLVHRRERRRRRREALARLRALLISLRDHRWTERFVVDGMPLRAGVILVANNEYQVGLFTLGERARVDEGRLSIYAARGFRRLRWTERKAEHVRIEMRRPVAQAAVDGEPVVVESPVEIRIEPGALRLLLPPAPDDS